jgi:hypothetical protein
MIKILIVVLLLIAAAVILLYSNQSDTSDEIVRNYLAGWRSSEYGYQQEQPPSYWIDVADNMSSKFSGYSPAGIWVVGIEDGNACHLQFPGNDSEYITFDETDINEDYLDAFDDANLSVWLQVEPADADVGTLIDLVLSRYAHHKSVIGFGVDVEWLEADKYEDGRPVTSTEACSWLQKIKSYNPDYKLFLKHWDIDKMPVSYTEDFVFISDSQEFDTYEDMLEDFEKWGQHFSDADVGFQYVYESDMPIWKSFADPAGQIGNDIINRIPNCRGLYLVDFTITDDFKP